MTTLRRSDSQQGVPEVTCTDCGRVAQCMRMRDGTVYKPAAWLYPDAAKPLVGFCSMCRPDGPLWQHTK